MHDSLTGITVVASFVANVVDDNGQGDRIDKVRDEVWDEARGTLSREPEQRATRRR